MAKFGQDPLETGRFRGTKNQILQTYILTDVPKINGVCLVIDCISAFLSLLYLHVVIVCVAFCFTYELAGNTWNYFLFCG